MSVVYVCVYVCFCTYRVLGGLKTEKPDTIGFATYFPRKAYIKSGNRIDRSLFNPIWTVFLPRSPLSISNLKLDFSPAEMSRLTDIDIW